MFATTSMMSAHTNSGFVDDDKVHSEEYGKSATSLRRSAKLSCAQDYGFDSLNRNNRSYRAYISVGILFLINLVNYMDRFTIAGILDDVQVYYSLNNEQAGFLQTAFVLSYMLTAPIFGYLGDRYTRKYLMVFGVLFWSLTTLAGSFVPEDYFGVFVLLRALVGIGEASYSTVASTIIADLFVRNRRSQMLALFYFAIPVGSGLGYICGSQIAVYTGDWKWSLRATPVIGLVSVILAILFLREPERGESEGSSNLHTASVMNDLKDLYRTKSYLWSTLGFTSVTFATGAIAWWAPMYMQLASSIGDHEHEIAQDYKSSLIFGSITCFAGIIGVLIGSVLSQYYRPRNPRADPLICAFGVLACIPLAFVGLIIVYKYLTLSWVLIFFAEVCLCVNWTIVADMLLYVVIPTRRALAQSFQILISHTLGDAISPYICGKVADLIIEDTNSDYEKFIAHQYSLYIPIGVLVFGGLFFLMTAFYVERDKARCGHLMHVEGKDELTGAVGDKEELTGAHLPKNYDTMSNGVKGIGARHLTNRDSKRREVTKL